MKSFRMQNIKSFIDSGTVELAPITIFVGKNSCGKSSLLRFPVVLAQTYLEAVPSPIVFNGKFVDYGFFKNVIHNQKGDTISYEYSYDIDINEDYDARFFEYEKDIHIDKENQVKDIRNVNMRFELYSYDNKVSVKTVSMFMDGMCLVTFDSKKTVKLNYLFLDNDIKKTNYTFDVNSLVFQMEGYPFYDEKDLFTSVYNSLMKCSDRDIKDEFHRFRRDANLDFSKLTNREKRLYLILKSFSKISNIMSHVYEAFRKESILINYIGPFREPPARIFRDSERASAAYGVGVKGENVSNILIRDYRRNSKLINEISKWMYPVLGYKICIEDLHNGFYQVKLTDKYGVDSDICDVGYGISQVLPILIQIIENINRNKIGQEKAIYIEQPELHLHPAAQAQLADLITKCVVSENNSTKLIIETHSEHLIRKLQVLISDKSCPLTNDMVKTYYVDKNLQGNAFLTEMTIAPNGKFDVSWPTGFFDQAHSLTMDLLKNSIEEI